MYLRDDDDIQRLATNIMKNTTPKDSKSSDHFWEDILIIRRKLMKNIINSIIHPTTRRTSKRLPMPENVRKGFRRYSCAVLTGAMILGLAMPAYAAGDPLTVVNNLSTFIFGLIRAVGLILLGWGIFQVGLSLQSHDPSQRSNGFLTLAGGIVITFAKEILDLIVG